MFRERNRCAPGKVEQNMTPMIDVVFQLLAFFVMTFKLAAHETDFNVKMPLGGPSALAVELPVRVYLTAGARGELVDIRLGDRSLGVDWSRLQREMLDLLGDTPSEQAAARQSIQIVIECDTGLEYSHTVRAIETVSAYRQHGTVQRLFERVNLGRGK